jgi:hypothetical protein
MLYFQKNTEEGYALHNPVSSIFAANVKELFPITRQSIIDVDQVMS